MVIAVRLSSNRIVFVFVFKVLKEACLLLSVGKVSKIPCSVGLRVAKLWKQNEHVS